MKALSWVCTVLLCATAAFAFEKPKLPTGAKKLTGAEIEALYRDATIVGVNFDNNALVSFSAKVSTAQKSFVSHVVSDGRFVGTFQMAYRLDGDLWCYRPVSGGPDKCVSIYRDGDMVYELNANGAVSSRNMVAR